ncbi:MAG: PrsW family intramembrane metalloprotease [Clostridia bacterium]|nr:PrsW family intramembrane metalloprotease [Clostridia bacterium]
MYLRYYFHPILVAAAVIPALALLFLAYRHDRVEKEPVSLLLTLVAFGALSTELAKLMEYLLLLLCDAFYRPDSLGYDLLLYYIVIGGSEEICKYLVLKWRTWRNPDFNYQFDGVIYAIFVSMGFAIAENVGYVIGYGFDVALIRAVTALPGHACFGVFMGCWYGVARRLEGGGDVTGSQACRILAVTTAILLHGTYDFFACREAAGSGTVFIVFIILMFVSSFLMLRKLGSTDRHIQGTKY